MVGSLGVVFVWFSFLMGFFGFLVITRVVVGFCVVGLLCSLNWCCLCLLLVFWDCFTFGFV